MRFPSKNANFDRVCSLIAHSAGESRGVWGFNHPNPQISGKNITLTP